MQVRVFESPDMATGLKRIKSELGPDALILSTRTIRNGKFGMLGKPVLEITAAVDNNYAPDQGETERNEQAGITRNNSSTDSRFHQVVDDPVDQFLTQTPDPNWEQRPPANQNKEYRESPPIGLQTEVNELKKLVMDLSGQIETLTNKPAAPPPPSLQVRDTQFSKRYTNPITGDSILSRLIDRGINVETARTIAGFVRETLTEKELSNEETVQGLVLDTIQDLIEIESIDFSSSRDQKRIALVGPTGVGKTTTLAKIAAAQLHEQQSSIALITIDTYRIAAVEQLKVYAEIMNLPLEVVISPDQLEQALVKHGDKDLILIDTAGRSPRDSYCIEERANFLTPELKIEKHLVLSATTRENELLDTIERFRRLDIANTIFTKIDECSNLGILLNTQIQNSSPLVYITNGQRVPEDILEATPMGVAELILGPVEGTVNV